MTSADVNENSVRNADAKGGNEAPFRFDRYHYADGDFKACGNGDETSISKPRPPSFFQRRH